MTYVMFFDLTRQKTAENNASPEQFLRVAWKGVSWAVILSLGQIKLFSIPVIDCSLITSVDSIDTNFPHFQISLAREILSLATNTVSYFA